MAARVTPYGVLEKKRAGKPLSEAELRAVAAGAVDGSWSEGQLAAFLMAAAIRGLDPAETRALTRAMLESGEQWALDREIPGLCDKHSTGGVGDKVSLVLSPILAACDRPVVMLTGRGLGHTGGTADKLETIPGLDLSLDRGRCLELLHEVGMAIGMATDSIAPADRRLYALRDVTATVDSMQLITASILSKKLATGAGALVFDVKTGDGAFLADPALAHELARLLVATCSGLERRASALLTDMSQPLGEWVGHAAEVGETLACLAVAGPPDLMEVVYSLAEEVAALSGSPVPRSRLEEAVASGAARTRFEEWVAAQRGDAGSLDDAGRRLAPHEVVVEAPEDGYLAAVATRRLGLLLVQAGAGRLRPGDSIDPGVSVRYRARLGRRLARGDEIARLYLRRPDERLAGELRACFVLSERPVAPPRLILDRIPPGS